MIVYAVVRPTTGYTPLSAAEPDGTLHPQLFYLTVAGSMVPTLDKFLFLLFLL